MNHISDNRLAIKKVEMAIKPKKAKTIPKIMPVSAIIDKLKNAIFGRLEKVWQIYTPMTAEFPGASLTNYRFHMAS